MKLFPHPLPHSFMPLLNLPNGGPDYDFAFLHEQIGPDHEHYEELCRRFAGTPQGERIMAFHKQNALFRDELPSRTMNQLDSVLMQESVQYTGERFDRIGKILAIRAHRVETERQKLKGMNKEQRAVYLEKKAEAENVKISEEQRVKTEEEQRIADRAAVRAKRMTQFESVRLEKLRARDEQRRKNEEFLAQERDRRKGAINPVAARKLAEEKRRKEEADENDEVNDLGADPVTGLQAPAPAPGEAGSPPGGDTTMGDSSGAPGADLGALSKSDRRDELMAMNRNSLGDVLKSYEIADSLTSTNEERITKILAYEFA